jgi:hypothetical protein
VADYGAPEVRNDGGALSVFYPEAVNGMAVYSTSGEKIGLTVNVDTRYQQVESVYGLEVQNYDASSYGAIVDTANIIARAEQGAMGASASAGASSATGAAAATQEIGLGTPTRAYVDEGNGLLIPAFVFPVVGSDAYAAGSVVMVPLVNP